MRVDFKRIKQERINAGLSTSRAAKMCGWTPQKWANLEAGRRPDPRISTLAEAARVLGCKVDDFVIQSRGIPDTKTAGRAVRKRKQT